MGFNSGFKGLNTLEAYISTPIPVLTDCVVLSISFYLIKRFSVTDSQFS